MRLAKGVVFIFLAGVLGSCFNPPEFPITPEIEFKDVVFKKVGGFIEPDSIILTIAFKDGDGDLGLDPDDPKYSSYPYHPIDYFLAKDGALINVATEKIYPEMPPIIRVESGQSGKLVTVRTIDDPGYEELPDLNCYDYNYDSVYVSEEDKSIFDDSYNLHRTWTHPQLPPIYQLLDTFYIKNNTNHYNITIAFEVKNTNGSYTPFDWQKDIANCGSFGYDGRFPVLAEPSKVPVPLDGTLRYAMNSTGFLTLFGGKTLRLKVQIKDRALHPSNEIYTKDFIIN